MAKGIKKTIIFILIIALLFLMLLAITLVANNNALQNQDNIVRVENKDSQPVVDIGKTYTDISGDSATIINRWNQARTESYTLNKFVKIVLNSNWVLEGALQLNGYQRIIIDLNGHSITRKNLTSQTSNGNVFIINTGSTLTIEDSVFAANSQSILQKAEELSKDLQLDSYYGNAGLWETESDKLWQDIVAQTHIGYIGGGYSQGKGGGIYAYQSTVNINGGMICNNVGTYGGGLDIEGEGGILNITNGIICANKCTDTYGGGVNVQSSAWANITGGLFVGNFSNTRGGGICIWSSAGHTSGSISNCVILNNYQNTMGGLYCNVSATIYIQDVRIEGNVSRSAGGGAYITGATNAIFNNVLFLSNKCLTDGTDTGGGLQICYQATVALTDCVFKDNYAQIQGAGIDFTQKGSNVESSKLQIGGFLDMSGNLNAQGKNCDINIKANGKIRIGSALTLNQDNPNQEPIYLQFEDKNGLFHSFTASYATFNNKVDPSKYFACDVDTYKASLNSYGELMFIKDSAKIKYEFLYLENNYRKNYSDNEKLHGYNDSGISRFVMGDIAPNTSVNTFINNILSLGIQKTEIQLYNSKGDPIYNKGNAGSGINETLLDNGTELAVGTGWYFIANGETIYLSVLGDVNGDGRISASDVSFLRQIASDSTLYESLSVEKKLASLVINKGNVTSADAEIVRNAIDKLLTINIFF